MLLGIKPFDINGPFGSCNNLPLKTVNGILSIRQGLKLNKGTTHKVLILLHKLNIKNATISLKELPNIILIPLNRQITHIHNELNPLKLEFLPGGNWTIRPVPVHLARLTVVRIEPLLVGFVVLGL